MPALPSPRLPPQRLGGSGSCYSLADQLCLDWAIFRGNAAVEAAVAKVVAGAPWARAPLQGAGAAATDTEVEAERERRLWSHPFVEGAKSAVMQALVQASGRRGRKGR